MAPGPKVRLFIAIELSDEVRAALTEVQAGIKKWSEMVRWIEPAQLHMTLKFLGEVPEEKVAAVSEGLTVAAGEVAPFDLSLTECGCFPPRGGVRIVWVAAHDESGRLAAIVEAIERQMEPLGFVREERPFSPHLTIGRVRDDRSGSQLRSAVQAAKARPVRQYVSHVTLMQSRLSPKGASYSVVSKASLTET